LHDIEVILKESGVDIDQSNACNEDQPTTSNISDKIAFDSNEDSDASGTSDLEPQDAEEEQSITCSETSKANLAPGDPAKCSASYPEAADEDEMSTYPETLYTEAESVEPNTDLENDVDNGAANNDAESITNQTKNASETPDKSLAHLADQNEKSPHKCPQTLDGFREENERQAQVLLQQAEEIERLKQALRIMSGEET
jgi:hypothetical protein